MARYAGIFIFVAIILAWFFWATYRSGNKKRFNPPPSLTKSPEALTIGGEAVRQLDKILTDPTLIGSQEWKTKSETIVKEWYSTK